MLRRWHKILAPFFAAFLLLIGVTGVAIQATDLLDKPERSRPAAMATGATIAQTAKARRSPMGEWNHWLKKIHSGEIVGGGGITVNLLSGVALIYFAGSGFWMYFTMWQRRRRARR
ncbi:MAG: hypothetical protein RIQ99_446 [Pseudomonadota bacterium]|jgi:uncharacterized iron-regulated membrane protein